MTSTANEVDPARKILGNDLVINEDSCNLGCRYCLTGQSNMKAGHENQQIFEPPTHDRYARSTDLGERLHQIVDRVKKKLDPPVIKLTGGEIFIIKDIMDFVEKMANEHVSIIVQTNALPLTDAKLERLKQYGNLTVQISLDSSTYAGNKYRLQSEKLHEKLLDRISAIVNSGLPTEIYAVVNNQSIEYLRDLVEWCGAFDSNHPQLFPFPVRGPDSDTFQITPDQHHHIAALYDMLDDYSHVLPPRPYIDHLVSFYNKGGRTWRCHLPRLVVSTFSDGVSTPCPNIWFHNMGDLTDDGEWEGALNKVNSAPFYDLLLADRPRLNACKGCFTPWDTLSLYFEDKITLDELCRAPSYANPEVRALLKRKKHEYKNSTAQPISA